MPYIDEQTKYEFVKFKDGKEVFAMVRENNAVIVASFGTFSTGINIKRLHNIVFASPSKSRIRNLQSIGRGLRIGEGKENVVLYDIADDLSWKKNTNYTLNHFSERINTYSKENFNYEIHSVRIPKCHI